MTAHNFLFVAGATSFGIAIYLYAFTCSNDLKSSLNAINEEAKKKKKDRRNTFELLKDFIQLHSRAKQLSKNFYDSYRLQIFSPIFLLSGWFMIFRPFFSLFLWEFSRGAWSRFALQCLCFKSN